MILNVISNNLKVQKALKGHKVIVETKEKKAIKDPKE
jgi:hypothetical protein